jgi:hypothetical protein
MAKPINLYQGPAPAAMGMMGQGLAEAGANIGRTLQGGYESMGKGLASGINAAASAYGDYKKMESSIKSSEKAYDTFKDFIDPEVRKSIDEKIYGINSDPNMSLRDKAAFWEQAKGFIGGSVNQTFAMQKQQAELAAKKSMMEFGESQASLRSAASLQNQIDLEQQRALNEARKYEYSIGTGMSSGAGVKPSKAVDLNKRFSF